MNNHFFGITELSKQFLVPGHAIRRLCNSGLIPHIKRNRRGHRVLNQEQVDLLAILLGMKQAGFQTQELRRYSKLYRQGPATEPERLAILTTRKHQLRQEIQDRQTAIDFIERQEELHQQAMKGKIR